MKDLMQHPGWKEALARFTFRYGEIITFEWLYDSFNIEKPKDFTSWKDSKKAQLEFLSNFKKLEEYLLEERQMALKNIRGKGYEIVTPAEQTAWAMQVGSNEIKNALHNMYERQINVNHKLLTTDEKKENSDAIARTSMLGSMIKKFEKKQLTSE